MFGCIRLINCCYLIILQKVIFILLKSPITIISMTPFYGGGEEYIVRLLNSLQHEFDFRLICCSKLLKEKLVTNKVKVRYVTGPSFITYLKIFFYILGIPDKKQHVLFLNGQGSVYLALLLPSLFKKLVYIHHTSVDYYNGLMKRRFVILCLKKVDSIICVSNFLKNEIDKYIQNKRVIVIYNWLPTDTIKSFNYPATVPTLKLLFMARLVEVKGVIPLIEVVSTLENVELFILGDGPLFDEVKARYGSSPSIHLLGWQNDKAAFLKDVHLNVVNSFSEGYSYTPVEAGVCGVPSLISDLEVHKEISGEGRYAFLFKTGSKEDLRDQLIYLNNNRQVLASMSEECKIYFTNKFVYSNYKEDYTRELR